MSNKFEGLENEDVVSVYSNHILVSSRTFTLDEFRVAIMTLVKQQSGWTEEKANWFGEGLECKILKPGAKKWRRGKVRIGLEFEPEELETIGTFESSDLQNSKASSPLDDIRQKIPKDN